MKVFAGAFLTAVLGVSCARVELDVPYVRPGDEHAVKVTFTLGHPEALLTDEENQDTKSYLTRAGIDTYISGVTLAIYDSGGTQAYLGYITSGFNAVDITLLNNKTYNIYAVANMGDQRTALSSAIEGGTLSSMTYTVDYSRMNTNGIPMAASVTGQSFSSASSLTVYLQRLLAKINVSLSCDWPEAVITGAAVKNVNPKVAPFGTIPASSTNPATLQDIHGTVAGTSSTMSAVFYVPENTQGTVGSVASSMQKTYTNEALSGVRDYATYLEVDVSTSGEYAGVIKYRSYLGANETTDFNIERNEVYNWTINYLADNLETYDWKRDTDNLYFYRLEYVSSYASVYLYSAIAAVQPSLRLNCYNARTGAYLSSANPTVVTARAYESSNGDDEMATGYSFTNFGVGSFRANFGSYWGTVAGPVYLEADAEYGGRTYTTRSRFLVHVNGAVRIEFLQDEYSIGGLNYYSSYVFWESVLPYKFIIYNNGVYSEQTHEYTYPDTGSGTVSDLADGYYARNINYVDGTEEEDWSSYTLDASGAHVDVYCMMASVYQGPYTVHTLTYSASYNGYYNYVTGTCRLKLYVNNIYIYRITSPSESVEIGNSIQLSFLREIYVNGVLQSSTDFTNDAGTTWSIESSSSGSTTGISIGSKGSSGGLLTVDGSASPTTLTISAQPGTAAAYRRYITINVVAGGGTGGGIDDDWEGGGEQVLD